MLAPFLATCISHRAGWRLCNLLSCISFTSVKFVPVSTCMDLIRLACTCCARTSPSRAPWLCSSDMCITLSCADHAHMGLCMSLACNCLYMRFLLLIPLLCTFRGCVEHSSDSLGIFIRCDSSREDFCTPAFSSMSRIDAYIAPAVINGMPMFTHWYAKSSDESNCLTHGKYDS